MASGHCHARRRVVSRGAARLGKQDPLARTAYRLGGLAARVDLRAGRKRYRARRDNLLAALTASIEQHWPGLVPGYGNLADRQVDEGVALLATAVLR
jgi:hypothetical protein